MVPNHKGIHIDDHIQADRSANPLKVGNSKKILVLDDERAVRMVVKMMLKKYYTVFLARNGMEAVDFIKNEEIDLVITDIRLEEEDGLDVMEKILKMNKNMKFIVISATPDHAIIKRAKEMGAKQYLEKPFLIEDLQKSVKDALK